MRRRAAFTLIEVLVSVLLVSVVAMGLWMLNTGGWRSVILTQKKLGAVRGAHLLFEVLHKDLKGARALLIAPRVPDPDTGQPGPTVFLIDGKEYVFDPKTGQLTIAGERWVLSLFEDVTLEQRPFGLVKVRIVSLHDEAAKGGPAGSDGPGGTGRTEVESMVTVDGLRGRERYPTVIEENRPSHGYCTGGDPVDF